MSTEADILTRLKRVEKQVEVLLDLHPDAQDRLRPRDAMATCDEKGVLGPGLLTTVAAKLDELLVPIRRDRETDALIIRHLIERDGNVGRPG